MEIKPECPKNRKCYGGYAGEGAWLCDNVEKVVVEGKTYILKSGEHSYGHSFFLDRALDSFSPKTIYCKRLGKIRIS